MFKCSPVKDLAWIGLPVAGKLATSGSSNQCVLWKHAGGIEDSPTALFHSARGRTREP